MYHLAFLVCLKESRNLEMNLERTCAYCQLPLVGTRGSFLFSTEKVPTLLHKQETLSRKDRQMC